MPSTYPSAKVSPGDKYSDPHLLHICLFGFSPDEPFELELISPDRRWSGSETYVIEDYDVGGQKYGTYVFPVSKAGDLESNAGRIRKIDGVEVIEIQLWWPSGLPSGNWNISFQSNSQEYQGKIEVE
jgi:hypothetical protein